METKKRRQKHIQTDKHRARSSFTTFNSKLFGVVCEMYCNLKYVISFPEKHCAFLTRCLKATNTKCSFKIIVGPGLSLIRPIIQISTFGVSTCQFISCRNVFFCVFNNYQHDYFSAWSVVIVFVVFNAIFKPGYFLTNICFDELKVLKVWWKIMNVSVCHEMQKWNVWQKYLVRAWTATTYTNNLIFAETVFLKLQRLNKGKHFYGSLSHKNRS